MPPEFWEWYKTQFTALSPEAVWALPIEERQALLIGPMSVYIIKKTGGLPERKIKNLEEMYTWLRTGVEWCKSYIKEK